MAKSNKGGDKENAKGVGCGAFILFAIICGGLSYIGVPPPWSIGAAIVLVIVLFGMFAKKSRGYNGQIKGR